MRENLHMKKHLIGFVLCMKVFFYAEYLKIFALRREMPHIKHDLLFMHVGNETNERQERNSDDMKRIIKIDEENGDKRERQ